METRFDQNLLVELFQKLNKKIFSVLRIYSLLRSIFCNKQEIYSQEMVFFYIYSHVVNQYTYFMSSLEQ